MTSRLPFSSGTPEGRLTENVGLRQPGNDRRVRGLSGRSVPSSRSPSARECFHEAMPFLRVRGLSPHHRSHAEDNDSLRRLVQEFIDILREKQYVHIFLLFISAARIPRRSSIFMSRGFSEIVSRSESQFSSYARMCRHRNGGPFRPGRASVGHTFSLRLAAAIGR